MSTLHPPPCACPACAPHRVATVTYCTCTPIVPSPHGPACPVSIDAHALGFDPQRDYAPPTLHREVVRGREKLRDGSWRDVTVRVPIVRRPTCIVVVLDTETTGLSARDRVIEVGMARVDLATATVIEEREQLLDPGIPNAAQRINGISDAMLRGNPALADIAEAVREWVGASPVLAHNAQFDRRMLAQSGLDLDARWICTKAWAASAIPGAPSTKLQDLATQLRLPRGTAHRALGDVRTTAALAAWLYERGDLPAPPPAPPAPSAPRARNLFGASS